MNDKNLKDLKIGIMGLGMVGGALKRYFDKAGCKVFFYDKGKNSGSIAEVNQADIVFICVPTPFDKGKGFDLSCVEDACSNISGDKTIVIKSTILPGTTEKLQKKYPQHKFLFNPEFLTEATADQDMNFPSRQIVGFTKQSEGAAKDIIGILPSAFFVRVMPSKEAEMIKYFSNTWYATKVVFANQIYDLCQKIGIDYKIVKEAAAADKMIGPSHLGVFHKDYRGYGGRCLPKDIRALIRFADENSVDLKLHKTVEDINSKLIEGQKTENPGKL